MTESEGPAGSAPASSWGRRTLEALDLPEVLRLVAARAASDAGRAHVQRLRPSSNRAWIEAEMERVASFQDVIGGEESPTIPALPDPASLLVRLRTEGTVLDSSDLRLVGSALTAFQQFRVALKKADPPLHPLRDRLLDAPDLIARIEEVIDDDGTVRDRASPELARLRKALRGGRARIVRMLEGVVGELDERVRVSDASVTVRQGRFVIPIRREGRGAVGGIVHDESSSGQTLFVEPPVAVSAMNDLRETELAEAREVHRILGACTRALRPHADDLKESFGAAVELDSLHARARWALECAAEHPALSANDGAYELRDARHPLLWAAGTVVPFDLRLSVDERAVVVSGPNAGGKTVLLKAVGLTSALVQSGIPAPLGKNSRIPVFGRVFADIGDRQSIADSLSTFSGHLEVLKEILAQADHESLVLVDEMGTGTDPAEGAALAEAVIQELVARGTRVFATSHLGAIKRLAEDGSGIVNASLRFDAEGMAPTFEFHKGRPGRSFGLAMARMAGLPETVLRRAEERVDRDDLRMEALLAEMEAQEQRARADAREAQQARLAAEAQLAALQERTADLVAREKSARRDAQAEARRILLDARAEVERAIEEVQTGPDPTASAREARRTVEKAADRLREELSEELPSREAPEVVPGDRVQVGEKGGKGTVLAVEAGKVFVALDNGLKVRVKTVRRLDPSPQSKKPKKGTVQWRENEGSAASEADLRGLRLDEVDLAVQRALDGAVLSDLASLRLIHGMGTGTVRARVQELLALDARVISFRLGGKGEGGTGVTVVNLR